MGWVGGGGDDNIPCTCTHAGCSATGHLGVGGMITFLAPAHMLDATQLMGWVGGGDDNIPCTCTHVGCSAAGHLGAGGMITFLAPAHMLDATQLMGWVGGGGG